MGEGVEFSFRLTGTGWAEGRLAVEGRVANATASYLSDALGGFVGAVRALLEGSGEARASWDEEPGEYRWVFQRNGDDVRVRLLAFPDLWGDAPDEDGDVLLDATCSAQALGLATASGAQRVLDEVGAEEYAQRWVEHPFPTDDLAALKAVLLRDQP